LRPGGEHPDPIWIPNPDALNLAAAVELGCDIFLTHDARLARFTPLKVEALP